jgi:methionine aminopeptidase
MTDLTPTVRQARYELVRQVIADAVTTAPPGLTPKMLGALIRTELRAYGLLDHTCDDLCGEDDDHHTCGEDGHECDDECVCHGIPDDEDDE